MADVDLVATKDFSYSTRRLKAGDTFTVPERMARVLVGIGKAERPRVPGRVSAPAPELRTRAMTATAAPAPTAAPKVDALDHDGDGRRGGSKRGAASTRSTGARRRRAAKKG